MQNGSLLRFTTSRPLDGCADCHLVPCSDHANDLKCDKCFDPRFRLVSGRKRR